MSPLASVRDIARLLGLRGLAHLALVGLGLYALSLGMPAQCQHAARAPIVARR